MKRKTYEALKDAAASVTDKYSDAVPKRVKAAMGTLQSVQGRNARQADPNTGYHRLRQMADDTQNRDLLDLMQLAEAHHRNAGKAIFDAWKKANMQGKPLSPEQMNSMVHTKVIEARQALLTARAEFWRDNVKVCMDSVESAKSSKRTDLQELLELEKAKLKYAHFDEQKATNRLSEIRKKDIEYSEAEILPLMAISAKVQANVMRLLQEVPPEYSSAEGRSTLSELQRTLERVPGRIHYTHMGKELHSQVTAAIDTAEVLKVFDELKESM